MSALPGVAAAHGAPPARRGGWPITVAGVVACAVLVALGLWQLERRAWKLALIERIEQRVQAPAVPARGPDAWRQVNRADHEYRRVRVSGRFLHDRETRVQAVTELGGGWWVLTPLAAAGGGIVLVNRGFVAAGTPPNATRLEVPRDDAVVTGLLRISEPGGAFLRRNDPGVGRWTSRDVDAIAAARGLSDVAPYFIDADAVPGSRDGADGMPVGGLTRLAFPNHHALYAFTWFALAAMVAGGLVYRRRLADDEPDRAA